MTNRFISLITSYANTLVDNKVAEKEELEELSTRIKTLPSKEQSGKPEVLRLFTRRNVSESLQISMRTLDRMTKDGKITAVKVGKSIRYRPSDIKAIIGETPNE